MLTDRGYTMPDSHVADMTMQEFQKYYKSEDEEKEVFLKMSVIAHRDINEEMNLPEDQLFIWYVGHQSNDVSMDNFRDFLERVHSKEMLVIYRHCMIISNKKLGSTVVGKISSLPELEIEHFMYDQLRINPNDYFLTPKHTKIPPKQAKEFFTKHKIQVTQIPLMFDSDAVARWYGWKHGDFIKIEGDNIMIPMMSTINFRLVVKGNIK